MTITYVYHQLKEDAVDSAVAEGLKSEQRGDKGSDDSIAKTDSLLDKHRPQQFKDEKIYRNSSIYGYLPIDARNVIDITNGQPIAVDELAKELEQEIVKITVNPQTCYVSDLDAYDAVRKAVDKQMDEIELQRLANSYWSKLARLSEYETGAIRRPEVIIPYDIAPKNIERYTDNT